MEFAPDDEVQRRFVEIRDLLNRVLAPEDGQMWFMSDTSTLDDVCRGLGSDPDMVLARLANSYGIQTSEADLYESIWQLVDRCWGRPSARLRL